MRRFTFVDLLSGAVSISGYRVERIPNEEVIAQFNALFQHLPVVSEKNLNKAESQQVVFQQIFQLATGEGCGCVVHITLALCAMSTHGD